MAKQDMDATELVMGWITTFVLSIHNLKSGGGGGGCACDVSHKRVSLRQVRVFCIFILLKILRAGIWNINVKWHRNAQLQPFLLTMRMVIGVVVNSAATLRDLQQICQNSPCLVADYAFERQMTTARPQGNLSQARHMFFGAFVWGMAQNPLSLPTHFTRRQGITHAALPRSIVCKIAWVLSPHSESILDCIATSRNGFAWASHILAIYNLKENQFNNNAPCKTGATEFCHLKFRFCILAQKVPKSPWCLFLRQ